MSAIRDILSYLSDPADGGLAMSAVARSSTAYVYGDVLDMQKAQQAMLVIWYLADVSGESQCIVEHSDKKTTGFEKLYEFDAQDTEGVYTAQLHDYKSYVRVGVKSDSNPATDAVLIVAASQVDPPKVEVAS